MRTATWDATDVIGPDRLREARMLANLTQAQLAELLHHSVEAVQKWERPVDKGGRGVPRGKEPLVLQHLGKYLEERETTIEDLSDMALIAELHHIVAVLARRMDAYQEHPTTRRGGISRTMEQGSESSPTVSPPPEGGTGEISGRIDPDDPEDDRSQ